MDHRKITLHAKNQEPKSRDKKVSAFKLIGSLWSNSTDEKVISLEKVISFLSLFQDGQTDILAHRDAIFNQNVRPMVHCFKGKFDAKKI